MSSAKCCVMETPTTSNSLLKKWRISFRQHRRAHLAHDSRQPIALILVEVMGIAPVVACRTPTSWRSRRERRPPPGGGSQRRFRWTPDEAVIGSTTPFEQYALDTRRHSVNSPRLNVSALALHVTQVPLASNVFQCQGWPRRASTSSSEGFSLFEEGGPVLFGQSVSDFHVKAIRT